MGLGHLVQCAEPVCLSLWGQNSGRRVGLSTEVLLKGGGPAAPGSGKALAHHSGALPQRLSLGAICHSTLGRRLLGDTLNEIVRTEGTG